MRWTIYNRDFVIGDLIVILPNERPLERPAFTWWGVSTASPVFVMRKPNGPQPCPLREGTRVRRYEGTRRRLLSARVRGGGSSPPRCGPSQEQQRRFLESPNRDCFNRISLNRDFAESCRINVLAEVEAEVKWSLHHALVNICSSNLSVFNLVCVRFLPNTWQKLTEHSTVCSLLFPICGNDPMTSAVGTPIIPRIHNSHTA